MAATRRCCSGSRASSRPPSTWTPCLAASKRSRKAGRCGCSASTRSPSPTARTWRSTAGRSSATTRTACLSPPWGDDGASRRERAYSSVGGGFVADEDAAAVPDGQPPGPGHPDLAYPFTTGEELLACTRASGLPVSGIVLANEQALGRTAGQVRAGLGDLWQVMRACVERGCATDGMLPGGLKGPRRAPRLFRPLTRQRGRGDPP